jgi:hypothetical protein
MSESKISGYCKDCEKNITLYRKSANHVLHLLLSICTFGLWLPVWFLLSWRFGGWSCSACGGRRTSGPRKLARL